MIDNDNSKVDASAYKGILPAHMRQGIPPYLQVLFAARPKLPCVAPINKPHKMTFKGFHEGTDISSAKQKSLQLRADREAKEIPLPEIVKRTLRPTLNKAHRSRIWKSKLMTHIKEQKAEYRKWLKEKDKSSGNKSSDPRNTIVVSNLVKSTA